MINSTILDPSLWPLAEPKISWARRFMPVTARLSAELVRSELIKDLRIGLSLVLEPKTAVLALALQDAGAQVRVHCHARSTRDDVAAFLDHAGIAVWSRSDATPEVDHELALAFLDSGLDILVDDGAAVTRLLHRERPELITDMIGATEETTSGVRPLRALQQAGGLRLPVVAANDARCKTLFDNAHGTGQSTLFTTLDLLDLTLTGHKVVVIGYGPVGQGVARHAAAFGADVRVAELDPIAALQAEYDGYVTGSGTTLVTDAELVLSATGVRNTITIDHLQAMPDGCAVAVAGGVEQEIALEDLSRVARPSPVDDRLVRWTFPDGHCVVVLDEGGCINCTAGEGNPIQIMDLSWGAQLGAITHLAQNAGRLPSEVIGLPRPLDDRVAEIALADRGRPPHHRVDPG